MANEAKALGLVDQIGYLDDAYAYAATQAKLSKPTVVRYEAPPSILGLLGGKSHLTPAQGAGGVTLNGVSVNLDAGDLYQLVAPRLMYLWSGN
jgi:ClpP class serine protease